MWWGIGHSKPYALRHLSLNQVCLPVPPIPHIVVPFTLTVSLKSGWGFRHRTETEGVKVPFATITTIPNIETALFIQPTAIGTVYEDLGGIKNTVQRMTAKRKEGASSSRTISPICLGPFATSPRFSPISQGSHQFGLPRTKVMVVFLCVFQEGKSRSTHEPCFCPSCYPTFSRTRTRAISFSFRTVGQSF